MDLTTSSLPISLLIEYSRVRQELQVQMSGVNSPNIDLSTASIHQSRLTKKEEEKVLRSPLISASLSPELSTSRPFSSLLPSRHPSSPLKQSIQSLKKSVQVLKHSSQLLYKNISSLSTTSTLSLAASSERLKSSMYQRIAMMKRQNYRSESGSRIWGAAGRLPTEEKSVQVDPSHPNPNETFESIGRLSFSQLADLVRREPHPQSALLANDSELSRVESYQDDSPRASAQVGERETRRHFTVFGKPSPVATILKRAETLSPLMNAKKQTASEMMSPTGDRQKQSVYYMKVVNVNGKYYAVDGSGQELALGKTAVQGISLKGKETTGGFRLFASAQEAMNQDTPLLTPKKGARISLMKVSAAGPSLRLSEQESVFTSVVPLDVLPVLAANVLVSHGSAGKKKS